MDKVYVYSQNNKGFDGYSVGIEQAVKDAIYELDLVKGDRFFIGERVEANLLENMPDFNEILTIIKENAALRHKNFDPDAVIVPNYEITSEAMKRFATILKDVGFDLNHFRVKNKVEYVVLSNGKARAVSLKEDRTIDEAEANALKKALGNAHKRGVVACRKHLTTKINSTEFDVCISLSKKGYMKAGSRNKQAIFHVTLAGAEKVGMSKAKFKEIPC